ncbi:hypothetical protein C8Q75DRAFT_802783 [Abortiporus biennis]|nr:hypothetical protein C8Q75DRAFT_802783 [Abortiporus biennis]
MLGALYNRPNRVVQYQRLYQASHENVHRRGPHALFFLRSYYTLFGIGCVGSVYAAYSLIFTKPTKE